MEKATAASFQCLLLSESRPCSFDSIGTPRTGRNVFAAFPENPSDPGATGVDNLTRSFRRVLDTGATDVMDLQKYDVEVPDRPGHYEARYWCPVNAPVRGPDGDVELIAQCVEEVTDRLRKFVSGLAADAVEDGPG